MGSWDGGPFFALVTRNRVPLEAGATCQARLYGANSSSSPDNDDAPRLVTAAHET